jgi:nitrilase
MKPYIAASIQAATAAFDTKKTLEKVRDFTADAAKRKAKTVLFPEAFIGGYPRGASFGAVLGSRTPEGRDPFLMYYSAAIEVLGPVLIELSSIAKQNADHLTIRVIARDRGTLY